MQGAVRILEERRRQIHGEGYVPSHDDEHDDGSLAVAGIGYAMFAYWQVVAPEEIPEMESPPVDVHWPWDAASWNPSPDPQRNLEKAGALLSAEWDRLERRKT